MALPKMIYSFKKGCGKVKKEDESKLREELSALLECKTLTHYYKRRKGIPNISAHLKTAIEDIFKKYDVLPEDVWEITEIKNESQCPSLR